MNESLRAKQLGVARGMGIALGMTIAVATVWMLRAENAPIGDRLRSLAAALAVIGMWLAAHVGNVARLRFFSSDAIDAGSGVIRDGEPALVQARAMLQNTLEQGVVAALAYVALALVQDRSRLLIVTLVALFSVGRALFWAGYARGAAARSSGFALTFYPSVAGLLIVFATLVMP